MNRYFALGVLVDMLDGKQVLVLLENRRGIRPAMDCILAVARDAGGQLPASLIVRWVNGGEGFRDREGPGRITFSSVRSSLRGYSPDVILLDCDRSVLDTDWWFEFQHTVAIKAEVIIP